MCLHANGNVVCEAVPCPCISPDRFLRLHRNCTCHPHDRQMLASFEEERGLQPSRQPNGGPNFRDVSSVSNADIDKVSLKTRICLSATKLCGHSVHPVQTPCPSRCACDVSNFLHWLAASASNIC